VEDEMEKKVGNHPGSVPVSSPRVTRGLTRDRSRLRIPDWLRQSPSARPAAVSLRSRTKPRRSGAGGLDPGFLRPHPGERHRQGAGGLPEGIMNEGMGPWDFPSTGLN
jgi:hypothetical protein